MKKIKFILLALYSFFTGCSIVENAAITSGNKTSTEKALVILSVGVVHNLAKIEWDNIQQVLWTKTTPRNSLELLIERESDKKRFFAKIEGKGGEAALSLPPGRYDIYGMREIKINDARLFVTVGASIKGFPKRFEFSVGEKDEVVYAGRVNIKITTQKIFTGQRRYVQEGNTTREVEIYNYNDILDNSYLTDCQELDMVLFKNHYKDVNINANNISKELLKTVPKCQ